MYETLRLLIEQNKSKKLKIILAVIFLLLR